MNELPPFAHPEFDELLARAEGLAGFALRAQGG